jgi:phosphoribosyl-AMP cyclohydrolase
VAFRGIGTDGDGDKVRLIVEVKPVGTAFTGTQSCYSVWVNSGTLAQCTVPLAPGAYHWRARMLDARTYTSPWASYGGTDEAAVDFQIVTVPAAPTGLGQFQTDGTTAIPPGATTTQLAVVFKGAGTDADGDHVRLIVEVKPVGTAFTGAQSCYSGWVTSGTPAQCTVPLPPVTNAYHWRARILDERGNTSAWVSYGGTDEAVADFIGQYVVTTPSR